MADQPDPIRIALTDILGVFAKHGQGKSIRLYEQDAVKHIHIQFGVSRKYAKNALLGAWRFGALRHGTHPRSWFSAGS